MFEGILGIGGLIGGIVTVIVGMYHTAGMAEVYCCHNRHISYPCGYNSRLEFAVNNRTVRPNWRPCPPNTSDAEHPGWKR
jgi:hypothetical protein